MQPSQPTKQERTPAGVSFWLLWTVATSAASGVVFLLPYWIAALVYGVLLGSLQWLLLRSQIARAVWWIPAGVAGWPLALAATYLVHWIFRKLGGPYLGIAGYSAVAGAAIGCVQWLVLRAELRRAGLWIAANALAWGLGFSLGVHLAGGRGFPPMLAGSLSGAMGGALTGAVLLWLLPTRPKSAEPS